MRCNPWRWLWGLIPIAILTFLTVQWEHDRIETDLRSRAETALKAAGLQWAVTAFDGRDGLITGQASTDEAPVRALGVVRDVWGVRISDQRTHLLQRIEPYIWSALLRGERVKLVGYVPTDEVRSTVLGLAQAVFPNLNVEDRLELARGAPDQNVWLGGISFGMKQLALLKTGSVNFNDVGMTIEGEAEDLARFKSIKGALRNNLPDGIKLVAEKVTAPAISPYTWVVRRKGNQIQLDGYVNEEALREQIFALAKKTFPRHAIVDRMEVGAGAPAGLPGVTRAAIEQLARLEEGEVTVSDNKVRIAGRAPDQATAHASANALRGAAEGFQVTDAITYPPPAPAPVTPYVIKIEHGGGFVTLTGHVPSEEARGALIGAVRKRFAERSVRDGLQLASGEPSQWLNCAQAGLSALAALDSGAFTITDTRLALNGRTRDESLKDKVPADLRAEANRACETMAEVIFDAPPEPMLTWRAFYDGEKTVTMEGEVIDARTRAALVQAATRYFANAQVQDRMTIKNATSSKWPLTAELGLKLISLLRKGEAVLSGQELLIRGEAKDTGIQTGVRDQLARSVPKGYSGRDLIEVKSDAMIWADQEAKRKAAEQAAKEQAAQKKAVEEAQPKPEAIKRREEADTCQRMLREVATSGIIQFEWASATLDRASKPTLDKLADVARACPRSKIEIEGHTDAEGTPERNKALSERRAKSVADYLAKAGVGADRLSAVGYGETQPVAPNDTVINRAKNRRIEFSVSPE